MSGSPSSSQNDRNVEIWATRVQRELLALTTGNESESSKDERVGLLPQFITLKEHSLNINDGTCIVSFLVEIAPGKAGEEGVDASAVNEGEESFKITVTLDASLEKDAEGKVDITSPAYPFLQPKAILTSGASCFPSGSTVKDGDCLAIDCDWTPSLHLSDAILNVGLKVKESILQKEPYHPIQPTFDKDPLEDLMKGAKRLSTKFGQSLRGMSMNAMMEKGDSSLRRAKKREKKKQAKKSSAGEVNIGDEINLLESPWVDAQGVYSCKAVRRPGFVEEAIKKSEVDNKESANAPFQRAGAMFQSFTQSARSVLEESFIMITDTHIIEMKSSKLNLSVGTVVFAIPIGLMAKLKFRRQESISLFFKPAPDDPLIYMCPDSSDAVHQIQSVLKRHGVRGKHTNAAAHRAINEALQLVQEIQTKELALRHDPSVERVNEIMDLYRQAAERFESAGDVRHEEVVTHMRKFLALPVTVSILDGSYKGPATFDAAKGSGSPSKSVPEGVVLERNPQLLDDELETSKSKEESDSDKAFHDNMDNILKEAQQDLESFNLEEDGGASTSTPVKADNTASTTEADDAFADLDAMLSEAGKELEELMKS